MPKLPSAQWSPDSSRFIVNLYNDTAHVIEGGKALATFNGADSPNVVRPRPARLCH